jgi:hypothetical protein
VRPEYKFKMTVFRVVAPCILVDVTEVSEVLAVSISSAIIFILDAVRT